MTLPPCFIPTDECATLLARVRDGLTVSDVNASVFVRLGFLLYQFGPSAGSGYILTHDGEIALDRWSESRR